MLSKKRLDAAKMWNAVEEAVDNETVLEGVVTEENKGGVVVNVKGIRVFGQCQGRARVSSRIPDRSAPRG